MHRHTTSEDRLLLLIGITATLAMLSGRWPS